MTSDSSSKKNEGGKGKEEPIAGISSSRDNENLCRKESRRMNYLTKQDRL